MNDDTVPEPAIADEAMGSVVAGPLKHAGRVIASDQVAHLRGGIAALEAWGSTRGWVGPDPYEGLNARRGGPLRRSPLGRRILIQAVKRSPLDLRRPLGVEPELDAASVAHVLAARAGRGDSAGVEWAVERLLGLRVAAFDEPCWGYHFDVETRFFFYPRTSPNTIATAFAAEALLDAHALTGRAELLEIATGAGDFFLEHVGLNPAGAGEGFFGYFPGDRTPIHNASALAAALLARLASLTGRADLRDAAVAAIGFVVAHQRADGAWPYAEGEGRDWVDGLHTGYVLDAVRSCAELLADDGLASAYERGRTYYAERLFLADGTPKFFADAVHPIDGQYAAQAIRTFSAAAADGPDWLERAWRTYGFAAARLSRDDGAFAFQRHRLRLDRTPHVRWVQAPMLDAMSRLLLATEAAR